MHQSSMDLMGTFIRHRIPETEDKLSVLDIGSRDVEDGFYTGTYKDLFSSDKFDYTGLDIEPGKNVDIVVKDIYTWTEIETDSFDIIISGQAFEHIEYFWDTLKEMARVLKKDGLMCIIAPKAWQIHRFPKDCWRFNPDGMVALSKYVTFELLHASAGNNPVNADAIMIAKKPYSGDAVIRGG